MGAASSRVPLLSVRNLAFTVETAGKPLTILEGIDVDVEEGEFVCIVGGSGCGKTTLLHMMAGLTVPTSGAVSFDGAAIDGPSRLRAIVFQDYSKALLPWRTVAGNVALSLEARGVPTSEQRPTIMDLLQRVGLGDWAEHFPRQLSGGMQQRLQIARCLAQEPRLLLMDEPFGALDAMTRQTLQDELAQLVRTSGTTVVFVTHDLDEAIYLGDRVVAMASRPGRIADRIVIDLPQPRDQLTTREDARFLSHRHHLFGLLPRKHQ
jgi:NitT/TauT family transport system ATP-binding protein